MLFLAWIMCLTSENWCNVIVCSVAPHCFQQIGMFAVAAMFKKYLLPDNFHGLVSRFRPFVHLEVCKLFNDINTSVGFFFKYIMQNILLLFYYGKMFSLQTFKHKLMN